MKLRPGLESTLLDPEETNFQKFNFVSFCFLNNVAYVNLIIGGCPISMSEILYCYHIYHQSATNCARRRLINRNIACKLFNDLEEEIPDDSFSLLSLRKMNKQKM